MVILVRLMETSGGHEVLSKVSKIALEMLTDLNKDTVDLSRTLTAAKNCLSCRPAKPARKWFFGDSSRYGHKYSPHNLVEIIDGVMMIKTLK